MRGLTCPRSTWSCSCAEPTRDASSSSSLAGACALVLEEYDGRYYHLRQRGEGGAPGDACEATAAELSAGLDRLLGGADPAGEISLFLGAVGDIPGLSAELVQAARASAGWDRVAARPRSGDVNGFVAALLEDGAVLRGILPGFVVTGVSVEKVLVPSRQMLRERTPGDGVPDARLPYDAQLWVRLRKR